MEDYPLQTMVKISIKSHSKNTDVTLSYLQAAILSVLFCKFIKDILFQSQSDC